MARIVTIVVALAALTATQPAASTPGAPPPQRPDEAGVASHISEPTETAYSPPMHAPLVDRFRAPRTPYGSGNRGWEYRPGSGTLVRSAARGIVVFAGTIAGRRFVSVQHPDGLRTTYSWLDSVAVGVGDHVERSTVVGTAGSVFHFGVRRGGEYLDPSVLFRPLHARLVCSPTPLDRPDAGCRSTRPPR